MQLPCARLIDQLGSSQELVFLYLQANPADVGDGKLWHESVPDDKHLAAKKGSSCESPPLQKGYPAAAAAAVAAALLTRPPHAKSVKGSIAGQDSSPIEAAAAALAWTLLDMNLGPTTLCLTSFAQQTSQQSSCRAKVYVQV